MKKVTKPRRAVHFTRGGPRVKCGLSTAKTTNDTRRKDRVTCRNCIRGLEAEAK